MNEEDILDKMLKDRLFNYYQSEAGYKTKDELVEIIITKELMNLQLEKEMEALKLKNIQLEQNILDIKADAKMIIMKGKEEHKKSNANAIHNYYQDVSSIKKRRCLIKEELSISSEESGEEDLKIKKSNSILKQRYVTDNVDEVMKYLTDFLSETKEFLISFLKEHLSYEEYKSNTNEIINSPVRLQMKEIQFYMSNLSEIQFYYKTLFVEYSNQLLQSLQNSIDEINKKITNLNIKFEKLTSHF